MLAPPWVPVPPPAYGGIESVVALLCDALVAAGHDVDLFCAPGSGSDAEVRPVLATGHPRTIGLAQYEADHVARVFDAVDAAAQGDMPYDVVHDHCGHVAIAMANRLQTPVVHTVHGPFDEDCCAFYARHGEKVDVVCLSHAQAADAPPNLVVAGVVPNPIALPAAGGGPLRERDHLLWMGRINPEKGPQRAIAVAREAGVRLVLAGPVQPGHEAFFAAEVEPHIDGDRVRYVGEVGGEQKARLFAEARAFLMPIRWAEPFGMVMVEALAAGTPVLAFPSGAAPEIVAHGQTGFLVEDEQEMARMVAGVADLDPDACRGSAAERWAPENVAAAYERLYRPAASRSGRSAVAATAR